MGGLGVVESNTANGFERGIAPRRPDVGSILAAVGSATAAVAPLLGVAYGVIRVGYEEYYTALGLSPETVGLSQGAIVSRVAVLAGTLAILVVTWVMFGGVIYRLAVPLRSNPLDSQRSWPGLGLLAAGYVVAFTVALSPALFAAFVAGGRGLVLWASGAATAGIVAIQMSWMFGDSELQVAPTIRRVVRSAYAGPAPKVGLLAILTFAGGLAVTLTFNFWNDASEAGRAVRATGRLDIALLSVIASPARVVPKGNDPLGVCDGARRAVLVGRHAGISYVLLLQPGDESGSGSEVMPLHDSDYAVATATSEPRACNRKAA